MNKRRYGIRFVSALLLCTLTAGAVAFAWQQCYRIAYPRQFAPLVSQYAKEFGVEEALVYAVIKNESDFRTDVVSVNDACGLMQLLPDTFTWLQTLLPGEQAYTRADLFTPAINIRYGVFFLSWLQKRFPDPATAAAAYHAGAGAVEKWLNNAQYAPDGETLLEIPYDDTALYVQRIRMSMRIYQNLYA